MISPSQYEQFHEWLNQCPTEILQYIDNTDNIVVTIAQPSYEEENKWLIMINSRSFFGILN